MSKTPFQTKRTTIHCESCEKDLDTLPSVGRAQTQVRIAKQFNEKVEFLGVPESEVNKELANCLEQNHEVRLIR